MTTSIMPIPIMRFYDNSNAPLSGGLVYTYAAGTSTPKATYTDSAGLVPHDNPIELNAKGEAVIYWSGSYKVDVKTSAGAQITGYPVDNFVTDPISGLRDDLADTDGASLVGYGTETVEEALDDIATRGGVRFAHKNFAYDYTTDTIVVRDGSSDSLHRHFGGVAEGIDGRLHLIYRRAAEHAVTSGETVYYSYSDDGGATWSAETVLVAGIAGYDQRGMSIGVTPSGRVVVIYDKVPAPAAAPVLFRLVYSDDNGATWTQGTDITSVNFSFARSYGRIKLVPGSGDNGSRLAWTPYYQITSGPNTYKIPVWYSDDDGLTWEEGIPIHSGTDGYNEAEAVWINGLTAFAAARGTGINLFKTTDGGATWSLIGKVPTSDGVAPSLDKFEYQGKWYLLLGYCDRSLDDTIFKVALVDDALTDPEAFGAAITIATDMVNASGYQSTIVKPDGSVYIEGGIGYIEFKEYVGFDYSQVRFVRADILSLLPSNPRVLTIASGVITVPESPLETVMAVDTEAAAATDDLDTINGGLEGQIILFKGPPTSSSRDVTLKNGTGNLDLENDFRINTTASGISLQKCGSKWIELGRTNDHTIPTATIAAGVITVSSSRYPIQISVDTEGGAATDDLDTINGGLDGQIITFFCPSSSRDVTFKDGTGNLSLAGDFTSTQGGDRIVLQKQAVTWYEISRSDNA